MLKKLFAVLGIAAMLFVASPVMAKGLCVGPCVDVTAEAHPNATFGNVAMTAPGSTSMNGGKAIGNFTVGGDAYATGKDKTVTHWRGTRWEHTHFRAGEATAFGIVTPTMKSNVVVFTNGKQLNAGLSYSLVKSTSELHIDGHLWAKGNDGCLQSATIFVEGSLSAFAYGQSYSEGPNGAFANAGGQGLTTVSFIGQDTDTSGYGFFGPNKASVDFSSTVEVDQKLFSASYVNKAGTLSANFAIVGGGSAELDLGRDGFLGFGRDNIDLTGISARGEVSQSGMATNGVGAFAHGSSYASFQGAQGTISNGGWFCGPDQTANVGGVAVVAGFNQVVTTPGSLTVTSAQYGYATTGNSAPQVD